MDEKIFQITKIIKKYGRLRGFKEYLKDLCQSIYPYRKILKKEHVIKILNKKIPSELAHDENNFSLLFKTILRYTDFEIWPRHIHDIILLYAEIFKKSNNFEDTIDPMFDLFEKLLLFY